MDGLRSVLSEWFEPSELGTVTTDRQPKDIKIPERTTLIIAAADGARDGDDSGQDESRFMTVEVHKTDEDLKRIRSWMLEPKNDISAEKIDIQLIWDMIPHTDVKIHKPPEDIPMPIRDWKRYLALIQCRALLSGRTTTTDDDIVKTQQLWTYIKPMINATTVALTRNEEAVLAVLTTMPKTMADIMQEVGICKSAARRALCGRGTLDYPDGGLLSKKLKGKTIVFADKNPDLNAWTFKI